MPTRRASAASHNPINSAARVHRSNGSNHSVSGQSPLNSSHNLPYNTAGGMPATPQQKVVYVLVNRLKNKLPCNAGTTLTELEDDQAIQQAVESLVELSRDSLDIIAWALTEQLDKLSKQTDANGFRTTDVLQSQLFILKVLATAMAIRYNTSSDDTMRSDSRNGVTNVPDSPSANSLQARQNRQASSDKTNPTSPGFEYSPLDDNCARYVLSVMTLFLRQTAPLNQRVMSAANIDFYASYHDFESVEGNDVPSVFDFHFDVPRAPSGKNAVNFKHSNRSLRSTGSASSSRIPHSSAYVKTPQVISSSMFSLNSLIAKFSGKIVYHLSATNWPIVFARIRNKIYNLASSTEDDPDVIDLQLLTHCTLDRSRLIQFLTELSSLLVNMKKEVQSATAIPLRTALWNWIDNSSEEFNDMILHNRRLDGTPERVFDCLYDLQESSSKINVWPTLSVLMCISADRMRNEYQTHATGMHRGNRKDRNVVEQILRMMASPNKQAEVGLVCALDICRAASRIRAGEQETPLQSIAIDVAHEIKANLLQWHNSQKPFWDYQEDIDVGLLGDALVTIYRFLSVDETVQIFLKCLDPGRSDAVKICVIRACITLITENRQLPWQTSPDHLKKALAVRLASVYGHSILRRSETDSMGNIKKPAFRPKAKRFTSETLPDRELLSLACLALYRADPWWYLDVISKDHALTSTSGSLELWFAPTDPIVKTAMNRTCRCSLEAIIRMSPDHPMFPACANWFGHVVSGTLAAVCNNLINTRTDYHVQRTYISIALEMMYRYTQPVPDHIKEALAVSERGPAYSLAEIAFIVSMTSVDRQVSAMACQCLRLLAQAERQRDSPLYHSVSEEERVKRFPVYDQLGGDQKSVLGRVAHQKRIRKLMRLLALPSSIHMAVWQECYWRWCAVNEMSMRMSLEIDDLDKRPMGDNSLTLEERQAQWQNLTLFMTAFGPPGFKDNHDVAPLTSIIPATYLPDQIRVLRDTTDLLSIFLTQTIDALASDSGQAREVAKDALGSELNPRMYPRIIKELDQVLHQVTEGETIDWDELLTFLDQFIGIFTILAENMKNIPELHSIDMSPTLLTLANLIVHYHDLASYRLKLKFCTLCENVFDASEAISMHKDSISRQNIVDFIIEWALDPFTLGDDESIRAQREVNLATLRTAVKLFDHLQLQPADGVIGEDGAHVVSRLFIRYTNFLLKVWEYARSDIAVQDDSMSEKSAFSQMRPFQKDSILRESVISGLASLISANTDFGVKHCLPLAYDVDPVKQTIFTHVFGRVLGQGIQLSPREVKSGTGRQSKLCELIKGPDTALALAICEVCPPSEVDEVISVLLNIFDTRSSLMNLLKAVIDREVSRTDSETALFRSNSTYVRFISAFAKLYGYNYLRNLIAPLIKTMVSMPPGHSYEIDPAVASEQEIAQNLKALTLVTSSFLEIITSSVPVFPSMFRELCAHIAKVVNEIWPESKFAALGAFIFLRFISPAVVTPEIIDLEVPSTVIRRGLKVIAKIIQNLANNIFFGKEAYMVALNDFLEENIVNVTRFLSEVNKYTPPSQEEEQDEWLDTAYDDTDTIILHRFFDKHADKIGKELLSASKPSDHTNDHGINGKSSWQAICAAIVENTTPLASPAVSNLTSRDHPEYLDLMARYNHRDTAPVHHLFVEASVPKNKNVSVFVLSVSKIDVEVLDIELLLFYIFKTLTSSTYSNRDFDIIFDWTSFSSSSHIPTRWIKFAHEVIPSDIRQRFARAHILQPNDMALKYIRRLACLANGAPFARGTSYHISVHELLRYYGDGSSMPSLNYAIIQEEEQRDEFFDVTLRQGHPMRIPVHLEVATTHLRIVTMKPSSGQACRATEIVPLVDISDVYNVQTGQDPNEFIIRKVRHGSTLYFTAPQRDLIVKTIRATKGSIRNVQLPVVDRFSKLSNVVATLLHVGMLNIGSGDDELRIAAYDLLNAVCTYLDFEGRPVVPSKTIFIPGHPGPFVTQLSEKLASFAPYLTLDFISEVSAGMDKTSVSQRINCLQYLSPWIRNLPLFMDPVSRLYEHSGNRIRDCIRVLIDLTLTDQEIYAMVQKHVWSEVGKLDSNVVNAVLDELMRAAVDGGMGSQRCEVVADIMTGITSINVRGRILARIRRVLGKTSSKPTKNLAENAHWTEIACLTRLALVANYHHRNLSHAQLYVPEAAHLVTLIAATGDSLVRTSAYGIVVNLLQAVYLSKASEVGANPEMRALLDECSTPETLRYFGLMRPNPTSDYVVYNPPNDKAYIDGLEKLSQLLVRIMEVIAGNTGLLNVWRARWMSLVTSSAFQLSPAIQTRAFVTLGVLATSDVDDDLLYQMLVAFKTALSQSHESDITSVVSMLRCIYRIVPALPANSRYLPQIFWLAVALLQSSHIGIYVEAIQLLQAALERMNEHGAFKDRGVPATLLDGRTPLEDIAGQLDQILGLSFDQSFSFSLASIIFKGIRHPSLRDSAAPALRSLMRVTVRSCCEDHHADDGPGSPMCPEVMGYFLALLPLSTSLEAFQELLRCADVEESWFTEELLPMSLDDDAAVRIPAGLVGATDPTHALLMTSFIGAILFTSQGDDKETEMLYTILSEIADLQPETISTAFDSLQDKIKDAFANASRPMILSAASNIFRLATQNLPHVSHLHGPGSASTLSTVDETNGVGKNHAHALDELGMQGLANNFQFLPPNRGQATKMINWISELVTRIIE
ncbi:Ras-GAP domain-containing protein [Abortiporus biennis]